MKNYNQFGQKNKDKTKQKAAYACFLYNIDFLVNILLLRDFSRLQLNASVDRYCHLLVTSPKTVKRQQH